MARRGRRRHRSGKKKLPLAIILPAVVPAIDGLKTMASGDMVGGAKQIRYQYIGIDGNGTFVPSKLWQFALPMAAGILVHVTLGKKVNRYIPKWLPIGL